jgi:hypothetical protein
VTGTGRCCSNVGAYIELQNVQMIFRKKHWTAVQDEPRIIFQAACDQIAKDLEEYGFVYSRSSRTLKSISSTSHIEYNIHLGTDRYNSRGTRVNLQALWVVKSSKLAECRAKHFGSVSDDVVTTRQIGYLLPKAAYLDWNMIKSNPNDVSKTIKRYGIPSFRKFDYPDNIVQELVKTGLTKEFDFHVRALDFIMCFGGLQKAQVGLHKFLDDLLWGTEFYEIVDKRRRNEIVGGKHKNLVVSLADAALAYDLMS